MKKESSTTPAIDQAVQTQPVDSEKREDEDDKNNVKELKTQLEQLKGEITRLQTAQTTLEKSLQQNALRTSNHTNEYVGSALEQYLSSLKLDKYINAPNTGQVENKNVVEVKPTAPSEPSQASQNQMPILQPIVPVLQPPVPPPSIPFVYTEAGAIKNQPPVQPVNPTQGKPPIHPTQYQPQLSQSYHQQYLPGNNQAPNKSQLGAQQPVQNHPQFNQNQHIQQHNHPSSVNQNSMQFIPINKPNQNPISVND